ncbi:G3E family GTPase [Salinibacterium sp. CAN_S4]|uniref:GTP-binding protein n=1 Tax=Salinibacterium sp. CAN_S4 TaxID=2787727 RepID=UPI0018EF6436
MSELSPLAVTLVSGLRHVGKSTVATILSGTAADDNPGPPLGSDEADAGELALELAEHLVDLADSGRRGDVIIELEPADPAEIALVLESVFKERTTSDGPALRELITVARANDIRRLLFRDGPEAAADDCDTSELLAVQLEFATAIILTGVADCRPTELRAIYGLIERLNPAAAVVTLAGAIRLRRRRPPSLTVASEVGRRMGWALELSGRGGLPTTLNSINTVVFRDPRPFHPARLAEVVTHCLEPDDVGLILRSRGLARLASRPERVASWTSAGTVLAINSTAMTSWDADSPVGQELVFVGQHLHPERIARALRAALLGDDELIAGPMEWAGYVDPFPVWQIEHDH